MMNSNITWETEGSRRPQDKLKRMRIENTVPKELVAVSGLNSLSLILSVQDHLPKDPLFVCFYV